MSERHTPRVDMTVVVVIALAVALAAGYWAIVALSEDYYLVEAPPGSTFNGHDEGSRILLNYLDELGVETSTLQQFDELPETGSIVVIAGEPLEKSPGNGEIRRLRTWVEEGGRLVLIGPYATEISRGSLSAPITIGNEEALLEPLLPSVYAQGVERISTDGQRMLAEDPAWVSHFKDTAGQAMISRSFGQGEVVWLASIYPASNIGIGEHDNARLVTLLVASGGPVHFDEYHHGFVRGGGIWERLGGNGQAAAVLGIVALIVLLVASARRVAPPIDRPLSRPARTGAYISSLAELYRKAGARPQALTTLTEALRVALVRRYGDVSRARAAGSPAVEVLDQAQALTGGEEITREQFVTIARDLARANQEVEGRDG